MALTKNQILPFLKDSDTPLFEIPYRSRVMEQQINPPSEALPQQGSPSNYVLTGFRPGLPLQAAELNEIQEQFYLQQSLTISMMHHWITSSYSKLWDRNVTQTDQQLPPDIAGIGDGGAPEDGNYTITGPGWKGACPLYPFANMDPDSPSNPGTYSNRMVQVEDRGTSIEVQFKKGWYLVNIPDYRSDDTSTTNGMGFKYWISLDYDDDVPYTLNIPKTGNDEEIHVGLRVQFERVDSCHEEPCGTWGSANPTDVNLNDQSSGTANLVSGGATRYRVFCNGVDQAVKGTNAENRISKVLKIIPNRNEVRYMNNLLLLQWD